MAQQQAEARKQRSPSPFAWTLLALVLVNLLARLPLIWDPANISPDGAEYLAIARSLRETGRYATDLKWQFYTDDPVHHAAWADRPPLFPLVAVLWQWLFPSLNAPTAVRLGNVLLTCLAVVLAAFYLRRLYGERAALLATGLVFLLPHTLFWTSQPLTEALALLLTLAALLAWRPDEARHIPSARAFGASALIGLAYLARPTGALLLPVLAVEAWLRRDWRALGLLTAGFLLFALPYHLLLWRLYGAPFHSALGYTFSVASVEEVTLHGFERQHPSALGFLMTRGGEIPGLLLQQALAHAQGILLPLAGLLPFAACFRRSDWAAERRVAAMFVLLTVAVHTLAWSARGSSRYFILCILLLAAALLPLVERAWRAPGRRWLMAVAAVWLAVLALGLVRFYGEQARPDRGIPALPAWRAAAAEVRGASLVASNNPWILNLLAGTPAVMLPRTTDRAQLQRFLHAYRPEVLVLFRERPADQHAWERFQLPPGWKITARGDRYVVARMVEGRD